MTIINYYCVSYSCNRVGLCVFISGENCFVLFNTNNMIMKTCGCIAGGKYRIIHSFVNKADICKLFIKRNFQDYKVD